MKQLLVVEDIPEVRRSYIRCFRSYAVAIETAATPQEAEEILSRPNAPQYLVCDHWLGPNTLTGAELIPLWRKRFPNLAKAALVTGSDIGAVPQITGIDAVFEKPPDIDKLVDFFGFSASQ